MNRYYLLVITLVILTLCTPNLSLSQGLGGLLNKAKSKVNQTVNGTSASTDRSSQAAAPNTLPATPPELTADSNEEYTRDLFAYADHQSFRSRSESDPTPSPIYWYCWLREKGFPIHFTWDRAVLEQTATQRTFLSGFISDMANDLVTGLSSTYGSNLTRRLGKVKEIHFTTSPKKRSLDDFGTLQGYFFSFNATTGVLTAAQSTPDGAISMAADLALTQWIIKYIK